MRILQTLSRFDGPPDKLVIDLQADGEYVALGTAAKVAELQAQDALWQVMPESEEDAKTRGELVEAAEVKPTIGKDVIKKWYGAGHLGKTGKGVARSPERFWKLNVSRSEPPVVATDQPKGSTDTKQEKPPKVGWSVYRDEVATDRLSMGLADPTFGGEHEGSVDLDEVVKSRSVGTPTLISDRPRIADDVEAI